VARGAQSLKDRAYALKSAMLTLPFLYWLGLSSAQPPPALPRANEAAAKAGEGAQDQEVAFAPDRKDGSPLTKFPISCKSQSRKLLSTGPRDKRLYAKGGLNAPPSAMGRKRTLSVI